MIDLSTFWKTIHNKTLAVLPLSKSTALFIVVIIAFAVYRFTHPQAAFDELCRTGTLHEVREAVAKGAEINPYIPPKHSYVRQRGRPDPPQKIFNDFKALLIQFSGLFLYYPKEAPLRGAVKYNPDPRVALYLLQCGAKDHDQTLYSIAMIALRRSFDERGQFTLLKPIHLETRQLPRPVIPQVRGVTNILQTIFKNDKKLTQNPYLLAMLANEAVTYSDDPAVLECILDAAGVSVNVLNNFLYPYSLLETATQYAQEPAIVELLINKGMLLQSSTPEHSPLLLSIEHKNITISQTLLEHGMKLPALPPQSMLELLHKAASTDPNWLHLLWSARTKLSQRDLDNCLWLAIDEMKYSDLYMTIARLFLQAGANINAIPHPDFEYHILTYSRMSAFYQKTLRFLLENGADVITPRNSTGDTPLTLLVRQSYKQQDFIALMLARGANPNVANMQGIGLMNDYQSREYYEKILTNTITLEEHGTNLANLIHAGLDCNLPMHRNQATGSTPLIREYTLRYNSLEGLTAILTSGADVNAQDNTGLSALHAHVLSRADTEYQPTGELVDQLTLPDYVTSPIYYKTIYTDKQQATYWQQALDLLIDHGADPNLPTHAGVTPLMLAATLTSQSAPVIKALLIAEADPNLTDQNGATALMYACNIGVNNETAIQLLLRAGAQVNASDKDGMTPLLWYLSQHTYPLEGNTLELLLYAGADVNARDSSGKSPLMFLAKHTGEHVLRFGPKLVAAGADVYATDNSGKSVLEYCSEKVFRSEAELQAIKHALGIK